MSGHTSWRESKALVRHERLQRHVRAIVDHERQHGRDVDESAVTRYADILLTEREAETKAEIDAELTRVGDDPVVAAYDHEACAWYVHIADGSAATTKQVSPSVLIDFDADGAVIGVEVLRPLNHAG